jgi:hypothetical protein
MRPAGLLRNPENIDSAVLVGILRGCALVALGFEFGMLLFESIRDLLEKDQTEDNMFILSGTHIIAKWVGRSR